MREPFVASMTVLEMSLRGSLFFFIPEATVGSDQCNI